MATYLILNLVFIIPIAAWMIIRRPSVSWRRILTTIAVLLVFTAVFDSIIIGLGIYTYDYTKTLGILVGNAPIEDFFYAVLAGVIVPIIWSIQKGHHETES